VVFDKIKITTLSTNSNPAKNTDGWDLYRSGRETSATLSSFDPKCWIQIILPSPIASLTRVMIVFLSSPVSGLVVPFIQQV
jgi:hypothetical protein